MSIEADYREKRLNILLGMSDLFYEAVIASQHPDDFSYHLVDDSIFGIGRIRHVYPTGILKRYNITELDFIGFIMADDRFEVPGLNKDAYCGFTVRALKGGK